MKRLTKAEAANAMCAWRYVVDYRPALGPVVYADLVHNVFGVGRASDGAPFGGPLFRTSGDAVKAGKKEAAR